MEKDLERRLDGLRSIFLKLSPENIDKCDNFINAIKNNPMAKCKGCGMMAKNCKCGK